MNIAAAAWIMVLPCTRGGLTPAAKILLLALWGHGTWDLHESQRVHPSRATLSAESGLTMAVVKDALALLADLGWIVRDASGWGLMWVSPAVQVAGSAVQVAGQDAVPGGSSRRPVGGSSRLPGGSSRLPGGSSRRPSEPSLSSSPSEKEPSADASAKPTPPASAEQPDPRQAEHERIVAQQAANAAEIRRASEAKRALVGAGTPAPTSEPPAEQHWLAAATRDLPQFAMLAAMDSTWRDKVDANANKFGWTHEHVVAMLTGYERERAERAAAGTLAADIAAFKFPQARHVLSTGYRKSGEAEREWHGPDGGGWASWSYKRWVTDVRQAAVPPRERWADRAARENRENRERYQALLAEVPS